jgi:ATP-dependent RNA helicase RhlE
MHTFEQLNLSKYLKNALDDLGFQTTTPIQEQAYPVIMSGKDMVGIAQTGTGKTFAYGLPLLQQLKFSDQIPPRVLILVPTRELVVQVVEMLESLTSYLSIRILGIYGGTNINTQRQLIAQGTDILVATPGRLYDLTLNNALQLKSINKLVIDEVDVMLDLGFRFQLTNLFELLPEKRQNIMFSATMTDDVELLIEDFFVTPQKISIAVSGTPLDNIKQCCYPVKNFYTKANLLNHLLRIDDTMQKVLIFVGNKKSADRLFDVFGELGHGSKAGVIHSNKSQNLRLRTIEEFENGKIKYLVTTDVMARGLDINDISHVVNFDTPAFPENYMHRIGRTGRAEKEGNTILFYTYAEEESKLEIEQLMKTEIPTLEFPESVAISNELTPEERPKINMGSSLHRRKNIEEGGGAFHEKKDKNKKENLGGSYKREIEAKYKKPKTRGDKLANLKHGKKKKK